MFFYFDLKGLSWVFYRLMQIYIKQNEFTEGFIHLAIELHIKHLQGISFYFLFIKGEVHYNLKKKKT